MTRINEKGAMLGDVSADCFTAVGIAQGTLAVAAPVVLYPFRLPCTTWQGGYAPNLDLALEILRHCNLKDQIHLAATSPISERVVKEYNHRRLNRLASLFFPSAEVLFRILWTCEAVISGLTVLDFLLGESWHTYNPATLDIYTCSGHQREMYTVLREHGYVLIEERKFDHSALAYNKICCVTTFARQEQIINITISKKGEGLLPVFQQDNTALMNFISYDRFYCGYGELTFRRLAVINPGPIYMDCFSLTTMVNLSKFKAKGFTYTSCHNNRGTIIDVACSARVRNLSDNSGMWCDRESMLEVTGSHADIFAHFRVLDCDWMLGGSVCGTPGAFVLPHSRLVKDQS